MHRAFFLLQESNVRKECCVNENEIDSRLYCFMVAYIVYRRKRGKKKEEG